MDDRQKQEILDKYKKEKEKGVLFFPDLLFKDALISLIIFLVLIGLAFFLGAPLEERADPSDATYTPRPEWYFLFLFQLLKYFPGSLEVIGVIVLPTLVILALALLPFLDRGPKRHFSARLWVIGSTLVLALGVIGLTIQSIREAPPPAEISGGDPTSVLFTENCAGCHGPTIPVRASDNLHEIIAQGSHQEGMPAWNADLTSDQIDALVGFILSPSGSQTFNQTCAACHLATELVAGDPIELKQAVEQGPDYAPHADVDIPNWNLELGTEALNALLNFLVAPDGQRLFATNCSSCHGRAVSYAGDEDGLREIISQGGLHLEMPAWQDTLSTDQLELLASYVVDPSTNPDGEEPFRQFCASCHGSRVPRSDNVDDARVVIAQGGSHETMPVWGEVLTEDQIDALVSYTLDVARGTSTEVGQELFAQYCTACHGSFGEGGANPARAGDVIAPISTSEYLKTRDDITLHEIISQGQPNFGMAPFGTLYGGPLEDEQVDAIVSFMRAWEANPPVELPPEVEVTNVVVSGQEIYADLCSQCHGDQGQGGIGPSFQEDTFQAANTDEDVFDSINLGHPATAMIAWGEILNSDQIEELVDYIREFGEVPSTTAPTTGPPSFSSDIVPIFEADCVVCHGSLGGWDASSYDAVISSGNNPPAVIPGDAQASLLGQKVQGTQTIGAMMPTTGLLPADQIQLILDWIEAGALDN
jgi:mono/diheme cytochrome c family protein